MVKSTSQDIITVTMEFQDQLLSNGAGLDTLQDTSRENIQSPPPENLQDIKSSIDLTPSNADSNTNDIFKIDMGAIACVPKDEQENELLDLGITAYDQTKLEESVMAQVESAFLKKEEEIKINQAKRELGEVKEEIRAVKQRLGQTEKALSMVPKGDLSKEAKRQVESIKREKDNKIKQLKKLEAKQRSLNFTLEIESEAGTSFDNNDSCELDDETKFHLTQVFSQQSQNDHLISTGEMTPFGTMLSQGAKKPPPPSNKIIWNGELTDFEKFLLDNASKKPGTTAPIIKKPAKVNKTPDAKPKIVPKSENVLSQPSTSKQFPMLPFKKKKKRKKELLGSKYATGFVGHKASFSSMNTNFQSDPEMSDPENGDANYDDNSFAKDEQSGSEYLPEESSEYDSDTKGKKFSETAGDCNNEDDVPWVSVKKLKKNDGKASEKKKGLKRVHDDGSEKIYLRRLREYRLQLILEKEERARKALINSNNEREEEKGEEEEEEEDDDEDEATEVDGGYKVPSKVWNKLFRYQQTGVRWLWELHQQNCGGIIGDEMGLGKTIQVIAFLSGLSISGLRTNGDRYQGLGPVILVCPATVMHQWVKEFHKWWPPIRVAILHVSGSYSGSKDSLIRYINRSKGILVTSYAGVAHYQEMLLAHEWHYIILDEGHKIRNPDAQTTLACKQFRTPHRIILSGSPIQNNLKELWSLFDFVFPGKLGTLPIFMQQFAVPITHGGYSNASEVQVQTAYKCAVVLRDTIKPYMLRRMKSDVKMTLQLPNKNEQVLFCQLSEDQRSLYQQYLDSPEIAQIVDGKFQIFVGLINLRKICNHPDIYSGGPKIFAHTDISSLKEDEHYGYFKRSGKMIVVDSLLKLWKRQGHRVLLFTQSRQMLVILEQFVKSREFIYLKMDGTTSIGSRQPVIHKFNTDPSIFVFLLTTRVGGLGVNLTGANRVIIYDPDWNPSTDLQARERAWRIGQEKQVTIYRLLTAGTIEEKIYHRQIFKQFLTNRVLKDPRQRRFFKSNDLHELFTLGSEEGKSTETSAIFAGTGSEIRLKELKSQAKKPNVPKFSFSPEKVEKMKEIAKKLSLKLKTGEPKTELSKESEKSVQEPAQKEVKKKKKKQKKDKLKGVVFEGESVSHLIGQEAFKHIADEQHEAQQDDYILKKLLKESGVKTALKHETIVNSSDPDYLLVEGEAERVAREAVKALKRSRRNCQRAADGIPTWTGSNGTSGAPLSFKKRFGTKKNTKLVTTESTSEKDASSAKATSTRFGKKSNKDSESSPASKDSNTMLSSSDLLARMRQRNNLVNTRNPDDDGNNSESGDENAPETSTKYDDMLCDIRNFVAFQSDVNGQATTSEVLEAFKDKVPIHGAPVFKALLAKICDFHRLTSGEGIWQLKPDFR